MTRAAGRLRAYLATDESLNAATSGRLVEASVGGPVAIGLTDRRLVCVTPGGDVADVRYDSIASITSTPRTRHDLRGIDDRIATAAGWLLASLGFVAFVAHAGRSGTAPLPAALFGFVTPIATGTAAYYLRRSRPADASSRIESPRTEPPRTEPPRTEPPREAVLAGGAAAVAFVAASASVGTTLAPLLLVVVLAGVGLLDYSRSHRGEFEGIELDRHREREISVHTVDGRSVHLRIDPDERLVPELSRLTSVADADPAPDPVPRESAARDRSSHGFDPNGES